ncbi:hypothetical protein GGTG_12590 [Gaeumannomyces tritici R3-111a-1]|uniref:Uncharacterized protein n=1 Tax=Gaeumannomyces tritici (strain R3-111a-1) TaxID=644352 RepID=J3PGG5_GAET3|nr:hypothetical protein GGTG_12590 [Gaeumannomyces tritici R3-111a-1]EJT69707.1 hypothetical protein GGTG_12590 [Gaeumannomyces tritici R3-111a-1]
MWVYNGLIAITYLYYTHHDVHYYEADSWTFVKGAVATIDRDFGFIDRYIFRGIIGTHRIPFYYAEDATEAIKPSWATFTTATTATLSRPFRTPSRRATSQSLKLQDSQTQVAIYSFPPSTV